MTETATTPTGAEPLLVITTVAEETMAGAIAREAVEQRLAACVHVLPAGHSVYRWQQRVEDAREHMLLLKTTAERYPSLEAWLMTRHPYETPEIIALPIAAGLPAYIDWIRQCTQ